MAYFFMLEREGTAAGWKEKSVEEQGENRRYWDQLVVGHPRERIH